MRSRFDKFIDAVLIALGCFFLFAAATPQYVPIVDRSTTPRAWRNRPGSLPVRILRLHDPRVFDVYFSLVTSRFRSMPR